MAWTKHSLPDTGTPWTVAYGDGRWFVWDSYNFDRFHVTADWSTFVTVVNTDISLSGPIEGVCFDGTNWRFVSTSQNGLWTSTDGSTGATWSKTTPDFSDGTGGATGGRAKLIHATPTGRLIVLTGVGVSYSDDGGSTWTVASTAIASTANENDSGIAQYGSDLFAWSNSTSTFLHSVNNGTSWSTVTVPTMAGRISSVAANASGWIVTTLLASDIPIISTDGGSSWGDLSGFSSDIYFATGDGTLVYLYEEDNPVAIVRYSNNLTAWTTLDDTGLTSDYNPSSSPIVIGASTLLISSGELSSDPGLYTTAAPVSTTLDAWAELESPLGSVSILGFNDFASTLIQSEWVDYYACDLVVGSTVISRLPLSSWQSTLQTDRASYVQAVIPAAEPYAAAIHGNPTAEFIIYKGARSTSGEVVEQEMARAPVTTIQLAQGPSRYTATISGYTNDFLAATSTTTRTLSNVRQVFIGSGGYRVRSAIDWFLRPGMTASFQDGAFTVAYINYYVGGGNAYMDVGERSL